MEFLSVEHLSVLAATLVLCVAAAVVPRRRPEAAWHIRTARILALVLVVNELHDPGGHPRLGRLGLGHRPARSSSPTPRSSPPPSPSGCRGPPPLAYELTFFWAFTATLQAVLTPDLDHGPDHYFFWAFFIAHSGVLVAVA